MDWDQEDWDWDQEDWDQEEEEEDPLLHPLTLDSLSLSQSLSDSLSQFSDKRINGEFMINQASSSSPFTFSLSLLRLLASQSIEQRLRVAAAVKLKTHLQHYSQTFTGSESGLVKTLIFCVSFSDQVIDEAELKSLLHEAIRVFLVGSWQQPLFNLVTKTLDIESYATCVIDIGSIANSMVSELHKDPCWIADLLTNLRCCFEGVLTPVFEIFFSTHMAIQSSSPPLLHSHIETLILCSRVISVLNTKEIDSLSSDMCYRLRMWIDACEIYLTESRYQGYVEFLEGVYKWVNLFLFGSLTIEPFIMFFEDSNDQKHIEDEGIITNAMKIFIKMLQVLVQGESEDRWGDWDVSNLKSRLLISMVIPSLQLTDDDEAAVFDSKYVERARRSVAGELLRQIAINHENEVTARVSDFVKLLLESSDVDWHVKGWAIELVASLAMEDADGDSILSRTTESGGLDVGEFFESVVVPKLQSQDEDEYPLLKASALNFFTMVKDQVPEKFVVELIPCVERFRSSFWEIVRSKAEACIDRLRETKQGGKSE